MRQFHPSSSLRKRIQNLVAVALLVSLPSALAQDAANTREDADLAEIRKVAEQVAKDFLRDRPKGAGTAIDRDAILKQAEQFSVEAQQMRTNLNRILADGTDPAHVGSFFDEEGRIDAEALAASAGTVARASRETGHSAPLFVSFVSLSMPDTALKSIVRDTNQAGGLVVVRGFYGGGYASFADRVRSLFEEGEEVGISIDPRYFQALEIEHVPTYAVLIGEPNCESYACAPLPADTVSGNISVKAALELLSQGHVAPAHARVAFSQFETGLP